MLLEAHPAIQSCKSKLGIGSDEHCYNRKGSCSACEETKRESSLFSILK
jgi:hypothetical protein